MSDYTISGNNLTLLKLASSLTTSVEMLAKLATYKNWAIKWRVALNPNTPTSALDLLAKNNYRDGSIKINIAKNPNAPPSVLIKLIQDREELIREAAFNNPNLPVEYKMLYWIEK